MFDILGDLTLTLNQPGSGKSFNYWVPFSFDLDFTRCKLTSPGILQMCNKALWFRESAQNSAAILLYLERARNRPDWEPASSRTLRSPGREMLSDATPHCGPRLSRTSPAVGWSVMTVKLVGSGKVGGVVPRQNF
jgi:hypothetical protein